ncbi:MAG: metal-dependent hydrolase [Xanthomonadaceae bacterium]|nr:metal-dependent hydrolase [Xanthomonadaceae bacterium]
MDPLTQGVIGAIAAQTASRRAQARLAAGVGFASGMLPDIDVLIRSDVDPLLFLEYHRHFTHALAFIPVGGLIASLLLWPWLRGRLSFARLYLFATLGYGSHGLLDACTTYGTQLLWPFSDLRVAWHNVAVIDPFFTVPLLGLLVFAVWKRRPQLARVALALGIGYLSLGVVQRERADALLARVAAAEGHLIERGGAKPTLGNLLVWRGVYESDGWLYAVALRPGLLGPDRTSAVVRTRLFDPPRDAPWIEPDMQLARDVQRFSHFSDGWLSRVPGREDLVGDFRYALLPDRASPLWAIRLDRQRSNEYADYVALREVGPDDLRRFACMIGGSCLTPFSDAGQ